MSLIHDVVKYEAIVEEVIALVKKAGKAEVGGTVTVPPLRTRIDGKLFEWEPGKVTRLD